MVLQVWSLNQPQQHHLKMCKTCKLSDPTPDLLTQKPWGWRGEPHPCLRSPPGDSNTSSSVRPFGATGQCAHLQTQLVRLHPELGRMGLISYLADRQTGAGGVTVDCKVVGEGRGLRSHPASLGVHCHKVTALGTLGRAPQPWPSTRL